LAPGLFAFSATGLGAVLVTGGGVFFGAALAGLTVLVFVGFGMVVEIVRFVN
jgi:hypothetical protein